LFLVSGTPVPQNYPLAVCADGINSANLFKSSAGVTSTIEHTTKTYLGIAADKVREVKESGKLSDIAKDRAEAAAVRADEEARRRGEGGAERPAAMHACNTALTCNRETSSSHGRGEVWITGVVAGACVHAVPGMGLAVPMFGPEEHYYYDEVFEAVLKVRPDLETIYLDLACRYYIRFTLLLERLQQEGHIPDAEAVKLLLPWMHGFDHNLSCQLKFSGMYTVSW